MKEATKELGKVSISVDGEWDRKKSYERLSLVHVFDNGKSYISKQYVPANIDINNEDYWQGFVLNGYKDNNIIILNDRVLSTGEFISYTLDTAVASIHDNDKKPGLVLGFYTKIDKNTNVWHLYQYTNTDVSEWTNLDNWKVLGNDAVIYVLSQIDNYPEIKEMFSNMSAGIVEQSIAAGRFNNIILESLNDKVELYFQDEEVQNTIKTLCRTICEEVIVEYVQVLHKMLADNERVIANALTRHEDAIVELQQAFKDNERVVANALSRHETLLNS